MIIYKITNLVNLMVYIGLSRYNTINGRYHGKWYANTHNKYLKSSVKKYGLDNFSLEILENNVPNINMLSELEQKYIKQFDCIFPKGYNFTSGGETGFEFSQIVRDIIGEKLAKEYDLINYLGVEIHIKNLKKFCIENNLAYAPMKNMVRGKSVSSGGWALKGTDISRIRNPQRQYQLESPDGIIKKFHNISDFCVENNLPSWVVSVLLSGKRRTPYKGWKSIDMDMSFQETHDKYKNHKVISPTGEVFLVDNVYSFALSHAPLDRQDLYALINRRSIQRKGWRLADLTEAGKRKIRNTSSIGKIFVFRRISTGEIINVRNLTLFCEELDLPEGKMRSLIHNKHKKIFMDFELLRVENPKNSETKRFKHISLINKDNVEISAKTPLLLWAQFKPISKRKIRYLVIGKMTEVDGWRIKDLQYE